MWNYTGAPSISYSSTGADSLDDCPLSGMTLVETDKYMKIL